jgi:hypothetical protein
VPTTYTYPTPAELREIEQTLVPRMQAGRPIFSLFPEEDVNANTLIWEQRDNYVGLMQVRGLNGAPPRVKSVGFKRYLMPPGVYGEYLPIDEAELTERAAPASFTDFIPLDDAVAERQMQLLGRQLDRQEAMGWALLVSGTFSVAGPTGAILHTDSYTTQTFTASPGWATFATATPMADLRAVSLKARGLSVSFGGNAVAYMNQVTFNNLASNVNAADIYGRRTQGLGTYNSADQLNQLFAGDNLPGIQVYDQGYLNDAGTFVPFIPDNKVVVVGKRLTGEPVGAFRYTRNASNPNMAPGVYTRVMDFNETAVPRKIEVHRGFNGGYVIYFPSAIVVMSV